MGPHRDRQLIPPFIPSARLVLSATELLERLSERLSEMTEFGLAPSVFGLTKRHVALEDPPKSIDVRLESESSKLS